MSYPNRRRSSSLLTTEQFEKLSLNILCKLPNQEDINIDSVKDEPFQFLYEHNDRERAASYDSSNSGDSIEGEYTPLEAKHFESALNHGVFSHAMTDSKRDRKKKYQKIYKRTSCDDILCRTETDIPWNDVRPRSKSSRTWETDDGDTDVRYIEKDHHCLQDFQRQRSFSSKSDANKSSHHSKQLRRSTSVESKYENKGSPLRKKTLKSKLNEKLRKELSNSGINLHDTSSNLTIEEIHDIQQKFYTGMNLPKNQKYSTSLLDVEPILRGRSVSFN